MSVKNSLLLVGLAVLALTACAVGPDYRQPAAPAVSRYGTDQDPILTATAGGGAQHFTLGGKISADWWRLFKSTKLDALINEAMAHNPTLLAAQASLRQSQDQLQSGYGIFYPQLDANSAALRQRYTAAKIDGPADPSIFNLFTLGASVSYALDIFGGERRLVEELGAGRDLAAANEQATFLTLWTNLINSVIARAAYQAEIDATIELIRDQQEQIALAETQSASGTVAFAAVLSLRSQLATLQASLPPLQQKLAQSESLLSTLAGHPPAEWQAPMITLADLTLPTDLPVSLPSNLVEQRPDILAASAVAHAASAAIGVATAAMLPNLNLTGTLGGNSNQTNSLLAARSQYWSFGASAAAPVFDGFTLWYQRKAAIETYQQAIALYRQTVLAAFAQVADSLRALDHDAATLQAEDLALDSALQARHLIAANYQAGLLPYLDLLTANQLVEQSRIARLQAVALRYQDGVALFAALGGGWWTDFTANRRDPSTD